MIAPSPGIEPTTQACPLGIEPATFVLVYGTVLQPSEPPSQGYDKFLELKNAVGRSQLPRGPRAHEGDNYKNKKL